MKRWLSTAGLSGLAVLLGMCAFPDTALAAESGEGTAATAAEVRKAPASAAASEPSTPTKSSSPATTTAKTPDDDEAAPVKAAPVKAAPVKAEPVEADPAETVEEDSVEADAVEADAVEADPVEADADEADATDADPAETDAPEAAPAVEAAPVVEAAPSIEAAPLQAASSHTITICHATGSATSPYVTITVPTAALAGHGNHPDDIIPAPAGGCPTGPTAGPGRVTICHATGSATNPYVVITVPVAGLNGHGDHPDDIIPAPAGGCPTGPTVEPGQVTICHATGSATNPYVVITVPVAGLDGHGGHPGDIIPAPAGGCPGDVLGTVTICHATGSPTNPYLLLTVPTPGLNGHGAHPGDIIPAPAGACPGPVVLPPDDVDVDDVDDTDVEFEVEAQLVSAPIPVEVLAELPATGFNTLTAALVALLLLLSGAGLSYAGRRRRGRLVAPTGPVVPLPQPEPPVAQVTPPRATAEERPTTVGTPPRATAEERPTTVGRPAPPPRMLGTLLHRGRHLAPRARRPRSTLARLGLRSTGLHSRVRVIRLPGPSTSP